MKNRSVWLMVMLLSCAVAPVASGDIISVNFMMLDQDQNRVDDNETGVSGNSFGSTVAGSQWNNILLRDAAGSGVPVAFTNATQGGNSLTLVSSQGSTSATLTSTGVFFANGEGTTATAEKTGDAGMFRSFLNLRAGANPSETLTVSNLPAVFTENGYNVVLYFSMATTTRTYGLEVSDGVVSAQYWTVDNSWGVDTDGVVTWVQATGTTEATATTGANFAVFDGLSASSFTITGYSSGTSRATLNGLQIIAIPEPSTGALLMGSALSLLGLSRWLKSRTKVAS